MKLYLVLFTSLAVAWAKVPSERVGCENNPCQHQCVDTVDSYYCLCFENFILQPDRHSCLHKNTEALERVYLGCWEDKEEHRDLHYNIWSRDTDATVTECLHDCRARGFRIAGLQNGGECWCGNTYERAYEESSACTVNCPGAPAQKCGGVMANSLYKVTRDERYMGCFNENENDPDLPFIQWGPTEGKSVDECVITCGAQGFNYSGVFNGGQCACGNSFGKHGLSEEIMCTVRCYNGWASDNCGGNATNAVYRVVRGLDLTGKLKSEGVRAEVPLNQLFQYPNYLGIFSQRMLIYATDTVNNIYDDATCTTGECYSMCGSISNPPGLDSFSADVIVRDFFIKMSDIPGRVAYPDVAQRVFVFVQTLYIDQSVDFPWSMYLHARQIIINYEANPSITFDHTGPDFGVDIDTAVVEGLPSDLTFQKLSLLCAKMLLSSTTENNNRIGWDIIDDLARGRSYTVEQHHFLDHVRAVRSEFTSVGRNDVQWVPYYTQLFYVNTLDIFYDQIGVYNDVFQDMLDSQMECQTFVDNAGTLISIWTDTVVSQALIIHQHAETTLAVSAEVYKSVYTEYNISREELQVAAEEFKRGLEEWKKEQTRKAMFGLIGSVIKLSFGIFPCGARGVVQDITSAVGAVVAGLELLEVTLENLAKTMEELEAFLVIADQIIETEDYARYMDNVESVAGLYVILPEWVNFKYQVDVIFREDEFRNIDGAMAFSFACFDLANWGEALTRSMIEYATNIRRFVTTDALLKAKQEMQERYEQYFAEVQQDCDKQAQTLIRFAEQNYDLMLELNDQLIQYCQAYNYEELLGCPEGAHPDFSYNVQSLLSNINQAKLNALYYSRRSSLRLPIEIQDDPNAWTNCTDRTVCPVKMFRQSRILYYELPLDHPRFAGIDLPVIDEIEVWLRGAFSTDSTSHVRVLISSSGPFYNRRGSTEATFVTRALSEMKFQYDIETEVIELHADLYEASGAMIKHMTPFTIWLIQVDPAFPHIDISQVETIEFVLHGPYLNLKGGDDAPKPHLA